LRALIEVIGLFVLAALIAKLVARGLGADWFSFKHGLVIGGLVTVAYLIVVIRSRER
jgi:hypothetical protein